MESGRKERSGMKAKKDKDFARPRGPRQWRRYGDSAMPCRLSLNAGFLVMLKDISQAFESTNIFDLIGLLSLIAAVCLVLLLLEKTDKVKTLKKDMEKLRKAFDEMDEQAKLIVKTDLELNNAQEEQIGRAHV